MDILINKLKTYESRYRDITNKEIKKMEKQEYENRTVSFDGKDLTFQVDNVIVTNGKLPQEFEMNGLYYINKESIAKLMAALCEDAVCVKTVRVDRNRYDDGTLYVVYSKEEWDDKFDSIRTKELESLRESVKEKENTIINLRSEKSSSDYKRFILEKYICQHNKLPWWRRFFGIDYKGELHD